MHIPGSAHMVVMSAFKSRLQSTSSGKVIQRGEYAIQNSPVKNKWFFEICISWVSLFWLSNMTQVTMDSGDQESLSMGYWDGMC